MTAYTLQVYYFPEGNVIRVVVGSATMKTVCETEDRTFSLTKELNWLLTSCK